MLYSDPPRDPTAPEFPIWMPDDSAQPGEVAMPAWPVWRDVAGSAYLKIDATPEVRHNYVTTWEDPDADHST